ncbi:DUF1800 domain-containing protein [Pararoseomonas sp. SCSIO 73927]|uniref:DUF1800 domain-containing protein n=1 Tax=Pararoseomonas sp. SCSIO 73927 TaxID=3114537 RepID=UPI0030CE3AB6
MNASGHVAALRFGLGPRPESPSPAGGREEARAALLAQLGAPPDAAAPPEGWQADPTPDEIMGLTVLDRRDPLPRREGSRQSQLFRAEARAYLARLVATPTPFRERLVAFWANHLTVSRKKATAAGFIGSYVRSAIRPHVTASFGTMLKAAVRHPAMLQYLDQASSIGPDSQYGRHTGQGLNENLAREVMELHTLSPAAGYTQADVTEFARVLTGLGVGRGSHPQPTVFRPGSHQPGTKVVMGQSFPPGPASVDAALDWLAAHPATHRHLAAKLARHFVADDPPPAAVRRLYSVLRDTGGDLGAVSREIVALPEAWDPPLSKLRTPMELVVAAYRAFGAGAESADAAYGALGPLGQPLWASEAPNGWPDTAAGWVHPEGMMLRLDRVHAITGGYARQDAREALERALGPLASESTREAVLRAGSNREALTFLLGSPEFQRR